MKKAMRVLLPNGELWVVIQKKQGAPSSMDKLSNMFERSRSSCKEKRIFYYKSNKKNYDDMNKIENCQL